MIVTEDHINLAERISSGMAPSEAQARSALVVRAAIEAAISDLVNDNRRGGTLYIPRMAGTQLWIDVRAGSLRIPKEVAVVLAPGVVLVPLRDGDPRNFNRLEIAGVLRAPLGTLFATPGWFARQNPGADPALRVAEVGLTSRRLERVHPEWWGAAEAREPRPAGDDEALAAALAAATVGRWSFDDAGVPRELRSVPVELRGAYVLSAPLVIDAATASNGVALRGAAGAPDAPTFRCAPSFPIGEPMVRVLGEAEAVTLEDLGLHGGERAGACVSIASRPRDASQRKHLLRRCTFQGARDALVTFEDERARGDAPAEGATLGQVAESLRVEHCRFLPRAENVTPAAALHLVAPSSVSVDVRGSTFVGQALAMVHALSCGLSLANCHFRNDLAPTRIGAADDDAALHRLGPEGGVDVYLGRAGGWPTGALYAQDCRSTSVQFLATARDASDLQGDCTLIGLHHTRSIIPGRRGLYVLDPPLRVPPLPDVFEPTPPLPSKDPIVGRKVAGPLVFAAPTQVTDAVRSKLDGPANATKVLEALHPSKPSDLPKDIGDTSQPLGMTTPPGIHLVPLDGGSYHIRSLGVELSATRTVASIHWHLPSSVTLMGCRFDTPPGDDLPAVDAFASGGRVIDLGIVGRPEMADRFVRVASGARHVTLESIDARSR